MGSKLSKSDFKNTFLKGAQRFAICRPLIVATLLAFNLSHSISAFAQVDDQRIIFEEGTPVYGFTKDMNNFLTPIRKNESDKLNSEFLKLLKSDAEKFYRYDNVSEQIRESRENNYVTVQSNYVRSITIPDKRGNYYRNPYKRGNEDDNQDKELLIEAQEKLIQDQSNSYVKIGTLDSGVDFDHPLLRGRFILNFANRFLVWDQQKLVKENNLLTWFNLIQKSPKYVENFRDPRPLIGSGLDFLGYDQGHGVTDNRGSTDLNKYEIGFQLGLIPNHIDTGADRRDRWPYPYLIRTHKFRTDLEGADPSYYGEADSVGRTKFILLNKILSMSPEDTGILSDLKPEHYNKFRGALRDTLNPNRRIDLEITRNRNIPHGTHIAGLLTSGLDYVRPNGVKRDAKIIPFRVTPANSRSDGEDTEATEVLNIMRAVVESVARGSKIINLSYNTSTAAVTNILKVLIESYPDVVFVVSAGQSESPKDIKKDPVFPCSFILPDDEGKVLSNVLCVGGLNKDRKTVWKKSNFGNSYRFVYAQAQGVKSTYPTRFCNSDELSLFAAAVELDGDIPHESLKLTDPKLYREELQTFIKVNGIKEVIDSCVEQLKVQNSPVIQLEPNPIRAADGTSQSAALVSRAIAKMMIEHRLGLDRKVKAGKLPSGVAAKDLLKDKLLEIDMHHWTGAQIIYYFFDEKTRMFDAGGYEGFKMLDEDYPPGI